MPLMTEDQKVWLSQAIAHFDLQRERLSNQTDSWVRYHATLDVMPSERRRADADSAS